MFSVLLCEIRQGKTVQAASHPYRNIPAHVKAAVAQGLWPAKVGARALTRPCSRAGNAYPCARVCATVFNANWNKCSEGGAGDGALVASIPFQVRTCKHCAHR